MYVDIDVCVAMPTYVRKYAVTIAMYNYVPRNVGIYAICILHSTVVGHDYYTELVDHYSSSSDQLAIEVMR